MTATDELRRLLDVRGVEWHDTKIGKGFITVFEHDGITWIVTEHSSGRLSVKGCVKPTQGHYDGLSPEQAVEATLGPREQPPYDELIEALRRDWDIEASWDGLRRFWYVGLTDEGVRKRDEREATLGRGELERENAKLRELVRDMWRDGMCECDERGACAECEYHFPDRMRELGVEVDG